MPRLHILAAIRLDAAERYRSLLTTPEDFETQIVTSKADAIARLASPETPADVLVVDGDVPADIAVLQDRSRFIAVIQGGFVKSGRLAAGAPLRP